jgi:hypothetical protein
MREKRNKNKLKDIIVRLKRIRNFYSESSTQSIKDFLEYKRDTNARFTYDWPELFFLRMDLNELALFLLKIEDINARRLVIMREELTGFSKNSLFTDFRINNNQLTNFTDIENRHYNGITESTPLHESFGGRRIIPIPNYPGEFLAFIALISRLPLQWLLSSFPEEVWSIEHFGFLDDVSLFYGKSEWVKFLKGLCHDSHDVRAVILIDKLTNCKLYLRVEILMGTVIIELCNITVSSKEYKLFLKLFHGESYIYGYMPTVIPSQINHTVIIRHPHSMRPICYPIEFIVKPPSLY